MRVPMDPIRFLIDKHIFKQLAFWLYRFGLFLAFCGHKGRPNGNVRCSAVQHSNGRRPQLSSTNTEVTLFSANVRTPFCQGLATVYLLSGYLHD